MEKNEIEKILNEASESMFNSDISVKFRITNAYQIMIDIKGVHSLGPIKNRIIKKVISQKIISNIEKEPSLDDCALEILELLNTVITKNINWNNYLTLVVDIDENIIDKAKNILKEHFNDVKDIYLDSISDKLNSTGLNKEDRIFIWNNYIYSKEYNILEDITSFKKYSSITKDLKYPYLILKSKVGSVRLNKNSTGRILKVENNEVELSKIKNTDEILSKCYKSIKPAMAIHKYIEEKKELDIANIELNDEFMKYSSIFEYKGYYTNIIYSKIIIDVINNELKVDSDKYALKEVEGDYSEIIKQHIDSICSEAYASTLDSFNSKIKANKDRFSSPYVLDILSLIDEVSKKGITTYISILAGDRNSKIINNDYDKALSYGKMSGCSKTFISDKIKELIKLNLIEEGYYRASFGGYYGLTLSNASKKFIQNRDVEIKAKSSSQEDITMNSLKELIEKLRMPSNQSRMKSLLLVASNNKEISSNKEDIVSLLDFIKNERSIYKDYENFFIDKVVKMIDLKYKPIFLLNANMSTGVVKKTFNSIYEKMDMISNAIL